MISLARFLSSVINGGQRDVKVEQFGAKTAYECAPFGDDGNPLKNMVAVYADTSEAGDKVIIGYLNEKQLAGPGEKRIYSLKPDGTLSTFLWLKPDGTMEIGGNTDNLVRFTPLDTALKAQDNLINAELAKIAVALAAVGGTYVPTAVATNIAASKINEVKTL